MCPWGFCPFRLQLTSLQIVSGYYVLYYICAFLFMCVVCVCESAMFCLDVRLMHMNCLLDLVSVWWSSQVSADVDWLIIRGMEGMWGWGGGKARMEEMMSVEVEMFKSRSNEWRKKWRIDWHTSHAHTALKCIHTEANIPAHLQIEYKLLLWLIVATRSFDKEMFFYCIAWWLSNSANFKEATV